MKVLWILLALLPSALWAAEQPRQWLDYNLQPVEAGSDKAVYYHAPAVRDGDRWKLTLYYKDSSDGEAVPALKTQLDGPELASAHMVGEEIHYYEDGSVKLRGTRNENGKWHGEFTRYRKNGHYTVTQLRNGVRHGSERHFYANGQLESEQHYVDGEKADGERIRYDKNGAVKERYTIVDGEKHGVHEHSRDGVVFKRTHYKHGQMDGLFQRFTSDGEKVLEAPYVDGERHGLVKAWRKGKLSEETHYRAGKRHGVAKRWRNGVLEEEVHYVDGRKRGDARYFYRDGSRESYEHRDDNGKLTERRSYDRKGALTRLLVVEDSAYGPAERKEQYNDDGSLSRRTIYSDDRRWIMEERYADDGEEVIYRRETVDHEPHGLQIRPSYVRADATEITRYEHGVPVGDYREIDKDGNVLSNGQYRNGEKVGDWVISEYGRTVYESYDNEGRLQGERREEATDGGSLREHYVAGELHGEQVKRKKDGSLVSRGEYRHGEKTGRWREYDEFVKGLFEGEYVDGKRHGPWLAYSDEGYEMARFRFEHGDPVGKSYVFARNGSLREVIPYKDGKKHGKREAYSNGALVEVERFRNGKRHGLSEYFLSYGERYMAEEYDNGTYVRSIDDSEEIKKR
ncbi:toxin-antitoxin system YwqK family antitoxin [Microbulbifer sp.]|uniref:toxin-antitoxin system YwqK family antitoxin n=1 Tax=Microbulbifer sp. TaxID=1908541 RepID=UPI002589FBA0|nr:toxin-antitoxin system YwqK family antitoxin [Microbulbifer sp.]